LTASPPPTATPTVTPSPQAWSELTGFATYGVDTHVTAIDFANETFVAVGWSERNGNTRGRVWTSADGTTWTAQPDTSFAGLSLLALTHNASDFYLFAAAPATVWRSPDGVEWEKVNLPQEGGELGSWDVFSSGSVADATTENGVMYAAGAAQVTGGDLVCECAALWKSADGTNWAQSTVTPPGSFTSLAVAGAPPFAVAIGNRTYVGDALMYTTGFDSWNERDPGLGEDWGFLDATADATRIVAVGGRGDFSEAIALVTDGTTWTVTPIDSDAVAEQVTAIPGGFLAIGTQNGFAPTWISADGSSWQPGPPVYEFPDVDFTPEPPGDTPFNDRTVGASVLGIVVADTFADGLHVWYAPLAAFGVAPTGAILH